MVGISLTVQKALRIINQEQDVARPPVSLCYLFLDWAETWVMIRSKSSLEGHSTEATVVVKSLQAIHQASCQGSVAVEPALFLKR